MHPIMNTTPEIEKVNRRPNVSEIRGDKREPTIEDRENIPTKSDKFVVDSESERSGPHQL